MVQVVEVYVLIQPSPCEAGAAEQSGSGKRHKLGIPANLNGEESSVMPVRVSRPGIHAYLYRPPVLGNQTVSL